MKKIAAIMVIFIFVGTALSAQTMFDNIKFSSGLILLGDLSFGNGKITKTPAANKTQQLQNFNFGGGLFLDATYLEIYAGCTYGVLTHVINYNSRETTATTSKDYGSALELGFSILGKYPIELENNITFFPLFGINFNTFILGWKKERTKEVSIENPVKNFSQFGLQAGVGLDYDISERFYFRFEGLFQLRFVTSAMTSYVGMTGVDTPGKLSTFPGIGPVFKAGIGFKFY
jgi:hypothetical protein